MLKTFTLFRSQIIRAPLLVQILHLAIFHLALCNYCPQVALADEEVGNLNLNGDDDVSINSPKRDPRLPPVIPGEEVVVNGKKIKVWSTSGPIPVSKAPQPFDEPARDFAVPGSVVVDTRNGKGR